MTNKFDPERLLHAVEALSGEIHILWQSLDEFRTDLIHEIRNRVGNTLHVPKKSPESVAETVSCESCDNSSDSLAEAVQNGWGQLRADNGLSWNFLGQCGDCSERERKEVPTVKGQLF